MIKVSRKTESLLDVLSSTGGLMSYLLSIVSVVVIPYNKYVLASLLTLNLVRYVPSESLNSYQDARSD